MATRTWGLRALAEPWLAKGASTAHLSNLRAKHRQNPKNLIGKMPENRKKYLSLAVCAFALIGMNPECGAAEPQIDTIRALPNYLRSCWVSPRLTLGTVNSKITVLMSFKRSGELLGKPRVTFQSVGSEQDEVAIRGAAALALIRCTPLPITDALGSAIAGQTFRMTFEIKAGHPI